ncbi:Arabinose operon regulatory protein [Commensalibacter sp. Nvir]|uniref:arabinose operon transcriptional regulator AraC n=1 Tax=Commensalibacter sp. Nvir TaxID=3069817 RepID=UPI002D59C823|nr:Arabinose operon regulatory protein [Commensalibacter sp. Nvir]
MPNEQHQDPLLPGYSFNAHLVAGLTPINKNGIYDFFVDRPEGMQGYIINLTRSGEGEVYYKDQSFVCHKGDYLIFPPGESHYYGRRANSEQWHHYWVYFRPRALWTNWLVWPNKIGKIGYFCPKRDLTEKLEKLFIKIVDIAQSSDMYSELLGMNLLESFLIRRMRSLSKLNEKNYDYRVVLACNYITENFNKLSQDDSFINQVSHYVHLSPSRISHLFKENMGVSISVWREDQRMNRAKFLLQTTPLSICQIAQELGYKDQFYFSRVFKNKIGLSPKKFRYVIYSKH